MLPLHSEEICPDSAGRIGTNLWLPAYSNLYFNWNLKPSNFRTFYFAFIIYTQGVPGRDEVFLVLVTRRKFAPVSKFNFHVFAFWFLDKL